MRACPFLNCELIAAQDKVRDKFVTNYVTDYISDTIRTIIGELQGAGLGASHLYICTRPFWGSSAFKSSHPGPCNTPAGSGGRVGVKIRGSLQVGLCSVSAVLLSLCLCAHATG